MSTSTNLDQKSVLQYICKAFNDWGIQIDDRIIKGAKKNDQSCVQSMLSLLVNLCFLHIFDYKYTIDQMQLDFAENTQQMKEIIIAHLFESQCPLILDLAQNQMGQQIIGFDFSSSRYMLLACGWLMAVSNFFSRTLPLFQQKLQNIYKAKSMNLAGMSKKLCLPSRPINMHNQSKPLQRVAYLSKILKARSYKIESLISKRKKLIKNLAGMVAQFNLSLQDCLGSNQQQIERGEIQLRQIIKIQSQNMGYRKYWWMWLKQKIINSDYSDLQQAYQDSFQKIEAPLNTIRYSIKIDLDYLPNYMQVCKDHERRLTQLSGLMQSLEINPKKRYKQIERQISDQLKQIKQRNLEQQSIMPSLIGLQLKNHMKITQDQPKEETKQNTKKNTDKLSKRLLQETKQFIGELQDLVFI